MKIAIIRNNIIIHFYYNSDNDKELSVIVKMLPPSFTFRKNAHVNIFSSKAIDWTNLYNG